MTTPMADSITHLAELARTCRACPPWAHATQTVIFAGDPHAKIMLVGEQPGDEEDVKGQPFVGPAGRLLDRTLHGAGIDRRHVNVTNAVKHSPHAPFVFATLHPSALLRLRDETERVEAFARFVDDLALVHEALKHEPATDTPPASQT
jgi:uracil-DNA glycosylase